MTDDEQKQLVMSLVRLAEAYNRALSPMALEAYVEALADIASSRMRDALARAARTCRWFPTPAEIRELAGAGTPDAGLVNALISRHVGTRGGDHTAPADPFLRLVVERLGGIRRASDMSALDRLSLLKSILPAAVTACAIRAIPVPTEALPASPDAQATPQIPDARRRLA